MYLEQLLNQLESFYQIYGNLRVALDTKGNEIGLDYVKEIAFCENVVNWRDQVITIRSYEDDHDLEETEYDESV